MYGYYGEKLSKCLIKVKRSCFKITRQLPLPFVKYSDFEAITEKAQGYCSPNDDKSFAEAYQNHKDCSYGYKVICCFIDKYTNPVQCYRGKNADNKFVEKVLDR